MAKSNRLKHNLIVALIVLLIALFAVTTATFAWYIYNTRARTTNVHMAAGTGITLQISDKYDGDYGSAALLKNFVGRLNPVSTDNILNGFQKVRGFTDGSENQPMLVANIFGKGENSDYYKTSLYFRTNGDLQDVYVSDISYRDKDAKNPISTAIRVGLVAHQPGDQQPEDPAYMRIFGISDAENPQREYNTQKGQSGDVLDSTKDDGSTVTFQELTADNFCIYDSATGATTLKDHSTPIAVVNGNNGDYGESVQVDVYIWLEGCDPDCTANLGNTTLSNLALSFSSYRKAG